jgi:hypothetical protein
MNRMKQCPAIVLANRKDLGPETPKLAKEIQADKPVTGWHPVK